MSQQLVIVDFTGVTRVDVCALRRDRSGPCCADRRTLDGSGGVPVSPAAGAGRAAPAPPHERAGSRGRVDVRVALDGEPA